MELTWNTPERKKSREPPPAATVLMSSCGAWYNSVSGAAGGRAGLACGLEERPAGRRTYAEASCPAQPCPAKPSAAMAAYTWIVTPAVVLSKTCSYRPAYRDTSAGAHELGRHGMKRGVAAGRPTASTAMGCDCWLPGHARLPTCAGPAHVKADHLQLAGVCPTPASGHGIAYVATCMPAWQRHRQQAWAQALRGNASPVARACRTRGTRQDGLVPRKVAHTGQPSVRLQATAGMGGWAPMATEAAVTTATSTQACKGQSARAVQGTSGRGSMLQHTRSAQQGLPA